ncbi:MAG: hypothetical protein R2851_08505 [Caldilineaceae bacterium]
MACRLRRLARDHGRRREACVNGAADVAAVHAVSPLPVIGIVKEQTDGFPVYITPSLAAAVP